MYNSHHIITSKHYLIFCTIAFAAGIFLFVYLSRSMLLLLFAILAALLFLILFVLIIRLFLKKQKLRLKFLLLPSVLIFCMLSGIFRIYLSELPRFNSLHQYENKEVWLLGIVSSIPETNSEYNQCSFEFSVRFAGKTAVRETVAMYVPASRAQNIQLGDKLYCWSAISRPVRPEPSDNFDYYTHLKGKNIFFVAETQNANPVSFNAEYSPAAYIQRLGLKIRQHILSAIDRLFSNDTEAAAILKGILLGDKSSFSDELYNSFSNAGISHIIAVSGLHVSILFSFLITSLTLLRLNHKPALILALPCLLLFTAASAFSLSVCRAAIMMLVTVIANLISRRYDPPTSLFLALGIILFVSPYSLFSKSLLLSFSATLGIFVYYKYIKALFLKPLPHNKKSKPYKFFKKAVTFAVSSVSVSLSTLIGTTYFLVLFFEKISKVQFLTNLWAIPLVSLIFILGYITIFVYMLIPQIGVFCFKPLLSSLLYIIKSTVHIFSSDRFSFSVSSEFLNSTTFIIYLGLAVMLYFTLKLFYDKTLKH